MIRGEKEGLKVHKNQVEEVNRKVGVRMEDAPCFSYSQ